MQVQVCVLILAAYALAEDNQDRRSKLPFIADALGNTLPPPSHVPATVGSPVNLLTPDRYEFYTFDESGELVKRLMTLEEIQAIVAAGEETEGLVTFANDNQPTIAFNFSQPPYTKVHSVVTNVQNVLKAQMEAHKNKPQTQPPFDTPDVSDSWSLILPSIFGNTGVDIVPDKTSGTFITPETETIELDNSNFDDENSLGKEGNANVIPNKSTTEVYEVMDEKPVNQNIPEKNLPSTTSTSTTTKPPITTTTTVRATTAVRRRVPTTTTTTTTTTPKPRTTTTSTIKPSTTTTKIKTTVTTTRPTRTPPTVFRRTTTKSTTVSPSTEQLSTKQITTKRPITSSKPSLIDDSSEVPNTISFGFGAVLDSRKPANSFVPVSTITYISDRTTRRPLITTTKLTPTVISTPTNHNTSSNKTTSFSDIQSSTNKPYPSTNSYPISDVNDQEYEKNNSTTITTQSVSPSTTVSSTEFITAVNHKFNQNEVPIQNENTAMNDQVNQPTLPLFDVAQSISQIASDLGGNYAPLSTSSNLLNTTKTTNMELESKENLEIDIPADNESEQKISHDNSSSNNFIKITTLDPHEKNGNKTLSDTIQYNNLSDNLEEKLNISKDTTTVSSPTSASTTIDPILSESMEDLLSQVVHSVPESIVSTNKNYSVMNQDNKQDVSEKNENKLINNEISTTEKLVEFESTTLQTQYISVKTEEDANKSPLNDTNEIEVLKHENNQKIIDTTSFIDDSKTDELKNNTKSPQNNKSNLTKNSDKLELTNRTTEQLIIKQEDVVHVENKEDTKKVLPITNLDDKVETTTSTESLPPVELTTIKLGSTTRQQTGNIPLNTERNKIMSTSEKNRLSTMISKDKQPLTSFPKVDEFKKKIQKVNIDDKELANERNNSWKLISTVSPPKSNDISKDKLKNDNLNTPETSQDKNIILDFSKENQGLEVTTKDLGEDITQFTELCNELAFQYWNDIVKDIDKKRSFVLSPYSITSMLAMMFMGARGSTSGEMNEILKLDDMVTFNPHFTLKNISDSIETSPGSGVAISAFIRELYTDRSKGKVLTFYKERAQHFYNGHVEEINFKLISDVIRRRTNLLVKRYTWGKIIEYMKTNTIIMHPPLSAFSANIFQTDCTSSSVEGRDGEMYFVVSPNVRQRRLVPVPAVVYRSNFLAGYDPVLDATAAALGNTNSVISTLFLMPGQQGNVVHAEDLEALEKRLLDSNPITPTWNRLLRTLLPRVGLELQIPRFSHKSIFNVSSTLRRMGLKDLFDEDHADLGGLNGPSKDLYLSDMIQMSTFVTCGEGVIAEQHHIEEYPETLDVIQKRRTARWATGWAEPRDYQRAFHDPHDVGDAMHLPLHLRPRQARLPSRNAQPARLKFDRPFLFFVRHNQSGMILYVGRYNPRLLP